MRSHKNHMARKIFSVAGILMASVLSFSTHAADAPELDKLKAEVEYKKQQIELLKLSYPVIEGGKTGTIKFDAGKSAYPIGAWERVYTQMREAANELCQRVGPKMVGKDVTLVSEDELNAAYIYPVLKTEVGRLNGELNSLESWLDGQLNLLENSNKSNTLGFDAKVVSLTGVAAVVSSAISITNLLRSDLTLYQESTNIGVTALKDATFQCLTEKANKAVYPENASRYRLMTESKDGEFIKDVDRLKLERFRLATKIAKLPQKSVPKNAEAVFAQVDKFLADLYSVNTARNELVLLTALRGEIISSHWGKDKSQLLEISIPQQGGISMISSSTWRSDRLYVGGGLIVRYRLSDAEKLVDAGTIEKIDPAFKHVPLAAD